VPCVVLFLQLNVGDHLSGKLKMSVILVAVWEMSKFCSGKLFVVEVVNNTL